MSYLCVLQDTGAASFNTTVTAAAGETVHLYEAYFHLISPQAASFRVDVEHATIATYGTRVEATAMTTLKNRHWQPARPVVIPAGYLARFRFKANATHGMTAIYARG